MKDPGGTPMLRPVPWFLATAPSPSPEMLRRPRLESLLDRRVGAHRTAVVSAPSGFGKTVAVSQWAAMRRESAPGSVTWLTLTNHLKDDGDVVRAVLTAMQSAARDRADAALHRAVSSIFDAPTVDAAFAAIAVFEPSAPICVVIDDFHHINKLDGSNFWNLVEHGPPWLSFVLITTDALDSAMTRLRLHGRLALVGASDLALTAAEIADSASLLGWPVDLDRARLVKAATGGWPAAVRLKLIGSHETPILGEDADLTEYIRVEVLGRMRAELADFILSTTVSTRLDESLARTLSGRADWITMFDECVSTGLFIGRYGSSESVIYQWHSLFALHCQTILRQRDVDRWRMLHQRAARELADRFPLQAVDHAIHADDDALATDIVAGHWLELLLQSRTEALDHTCIAAINAFGENPELLMIRACCRNLAGDAANSDLLLARATKLGPTESPSPRMSFIADISVVLTANDYDEITAAALRAEAALTDRTVVPPAVYACALFVLGWAHSRMRRGQHASPLLEAAIHECRTRGLTEVAERARQSLAFASASAGEFTRALSLLHNPAARPTTTPGLWLSHDGDGIERFTEGYVQFWRGELDGALENFLLVNDAVGSGYPDVGRLMLALTLCTLADPSTFKLAESVAMRIPDADSHGVPWSVYKLASRARVAEAQGERAHALALAKQLLSRQHIPMCSAIAAGVSRRVGDEALALQLIEGDRVGRGQPYSHAYAEYIAALLDWGAGRRDTAHRRLEDALTVAVPERVRYAFVDNTDADALALLAAHASVTAHKDFLDECLQAAEHSATRHAPTTPLTVREREVLAFLRTPMTSNEIASKLAVSVNTLKTHQRSIYRKLGAANRREAIRLASTRL